jgi:hypothetical protein
VNGKLETVEGHPALRFERRLGHSVERVWQAITDPEELSHWFPAKEELRISESDPPRVLAGTWYGDPLRFELRAEGEECVLVFTHTFAGRETAARDAAGWDRCFARFDALLEGRQLSEADSLQAWPEAHESYAERFGVDPRIGREAFAKYHSRQQ